MRIGINLDDTIIDIYQVVMKKVAKFYDIDEEGFYLQYNEYSLLDKFPAIDIFYRENPYEDVLNNTMLNSNAKEVINRLYDDGNEIYIFSNRNKKIVKNYLRKSGIKFNRIILEKNIINDCILNRINIYIGLEYRKCQKLSLNGIKCYQLKTKFYKKVYSDSYDNWNDIYFKIISKEIKECK